MKFTEIDRERFNNPGVYKISSISKPYRYYIGSSLSVYTRIKTHSYNLRDNKHHAAKLQRHYNKYGIDDLNIDILYCGEEYRDKINDIEQNLLFSEKPYFNSSPKAYSLKGIKWSDNTKQRMSEAHCKRHGEVQPIENGMIVIDWWSEGRNGRHVKVMCQVCKGTKRYKLSELRKRTKMHCGCIKCVPIPISKLPKKTPNYDHVRSCKRIDNTSGWSGVTYDKLAKKWRARVRNGKRMLSAGNYNCPTVAVIARDEFINSKRLPHPLQILKGPP